MVTHLRRATWRTTLITLAALVIGYYIVAGLAMTFTTTSVSGCTDAPGSAHVCGRP